MKALVLKTFKKPWNLEDVPVPEPSSGQVLIKIHASGLCGTDLHFSEQIYPLKLPLIMGHEPVGEIVKLGEGVTDLKLGDKVGVVWHQKGCHRCPYCQSQKDLYCTGYLGGAKTWMDLGGSHAEYMLAYSSGCILLPDDLDFIHAAPLMCAGFTIASGYMNADPKPLETVAVLGIGGLGHLALQYAKAKGHRVIAITEHDHKKELCYKLGADEVIIASDHLGYDLKKLGGADIILDCSSHSQIKQLCLKGLKPGGRFVLMGLDKDPLVISSLELIPLQARLIGSTQNNRSDLIDILELASKGKLRPVVEVFSLEDHEKACQKLKDQSLHFRAVFKVI